MTTLLQFARVILITLNPPVKMTKHKLLSDILKKYDPLVYIALILNNGNIFLQQL